MTVDLSGQVAIITAGGRGLGRHFVQSIAAVGISLFAISPGAVRTSMSEDGMSSDRNGCLGSLRFSKRGEMCHLIWLST